MASLGDYEVIKHWLGSWLKQLVELDSPDNDYRVILSELEDSEAHRESLARLDAHLDEASAKCGDFGRLLAEKGKLPSDLEEANKTVLNKLAEVRAVIGLGRVGFSAIEFVGSPDLRASFDGDICLVEVTRLGSSKGKRADVWDSEMGSIESGIHIGTMSQHGKVSGAISEAVYREIEDKYPQLKDAMTDGEMLMLWISLGRDYLTCGRYELPGVGSLARMSRTPRGALESALSAIAETGLYKKLSHVVLCPGRDLKDLVLPSLPHD